MNSKIGHGKIRFLGKQWLWKEKPIPLEICEENDHFPHEYDDKDRKVIRKLCHLCRIFWEEKGHYALKVNSKKDGGDGSL